MKRRTALVVLLVPALALAGGAAWYLWPAPAVTPEWAADYDVDAKPPEAIAPGTVVGTTPPDGWSHLVIKSLPRVRPGQEGTIPPLARSETVRMTRWMFTAFVADVRPETRGTETRHQLRAIALGLGTSVNGRDVVITPDTAKAHGVSLDWITNQILTKGYQTQAQARVVVQGPTFGLLDTPVWFRCGDQNRLVRFRYALLVDATTGRLDVLLWLLDPAHDCGDRDAVVLLNPNQLHEAELVPDRKGFDAFGIASPSAFAIDELPSHRSRMTIPPDLGELARKTKFTPDEAGALEAGLRELLVR